MYFNQLYIVMYFDNTMQQIWISQSFLTRLRCNKTFKFFYANNKCIRFNRKFSAHQVSEKTRRKYERMHAFCQLWSVFFFFKRSSQRFQTVWKIDIKNCTTVASFPMNSIRWKFSTETEMPVLRHEIITIHFLLPIMLRKLLTSVITNYLRLNCINGNLQSWKGPPLPDEFVEFPWQLCRRFS